MTRSVALLFVLAACASPAPAPQADFTFQGKDYTIFREGAAWRVGQRGDTVICRAPTEEDCYWSLRAKLAAQNALDELP